MQAFFYLSTTPEADREFAVRVHSRFVHRYGPLPLLELRPDAWEEPFVLAAPASTELSTWGSG